MAKENKSQTLSPQEEQVKNLEEQVKNLADNHYFNKTDFTLECHHTFTKKPKNFLEKISAGVGLAELFEANFGVERKCADYIERDPEKCFIESYSTHSIPHKKGYIQKLEIFYKNAVGERELIQSKYLDADREIFLVNENSQVPTIVQGQKGKTEMIPGVKSYLADLVQLQQSKPELPEYVASRDEIKLDNNASDQNQQPNAEGYNIDAQRNLRQGHVGQFGAFDDDTGKAKGNIIAKDNKVIDSWGDMGTVTVGPEAGRRKDAELQRQHEEHKVAKTREFFKNMLDQTNAELKEVEGKLEKEEERKKPIEDRLLRYQKQITELKETKKEWQNKLKETN